MAARKTSTRTAKPDTAAEKTVQMVQNIVGYPPPPTRVTLPAATAERFVTRGYATPVTDA
jgi:hypothetical protein